MKHKRIVVTGMGAVTSLGPTVPVIWDQLLAGKSGVSKIDFFDASPYASQISASVREFDPELFMPIKDARKTDLFIQYGIAAAHEALKDSGLEITETNAHRVGVAVGSGIGGLPMIEYSHQLMIEKGARKISPFFIPAVIINMLPGHISILHGARGPNISIVTACTTGAHNIGQAARIIAYGDADAMICGGAEMATCAMGIGGFSAMRALSTRNDEPEKASRPWDRDRDGFVLGDGAGILIIESLESAKARGAKIYAELVGFGMSGDAYHMTMPDARGSRLAMEHALSDAHLNKEDIDYVNAHGTSTPVGDMAELESVRSVFGDHATHGLAMSSTKSMTGHLIAAAGAIEAIFSILSIRDKVIPPTINLDNPSEGCEGMNLVPHTAQERDVKAVLSNSFGFGGTNGTLAFKEFKD